MVGGPSSVPPVRQWTPSELVAHAHAKRVAVLDAGDLVVVTSGLNRIVDIKYGVVLRPSLIVPAVSFCRPT
jgi:hypothetical protein